MKIQPVDPDEENTDLEKLFSAIWRDVLEDLTEMDENGANPVIVLDDDLTLTELRDGIKEGLREAVLGKCMPIETLWDEIN